MVLAGPRYSHEVEFAQTLIFEEALFALSGDDSTPEQDSLGLDDRPQARSPDDQQIPPQRDQARTSVPGGEAGHRCCSSPVELAVISP